jgi:hypothetical protein
MKRLSTFVIPILFVAVAFEVSSPKAKADIWGGDVVVLTQILAETIEEIYKMEQILGKASETVSVLEDMNSGVKEVLRIAQTAHAQLPPRVYAQASEINAATTLAQATYGGVGDHSPTYVRSNYRSGVEALNLSEDAFDYSTFLDDKGERVKSSAVLANQASATRLTAETLGIILHSVNHASRIQAKELELNSNNKIEDSARESARFNSYENTHQRFEDDLNQSSFSSLNGVGY